MLEIANVRKFSSISTQIITLHQRVSYCSITQYGMFINAELDMVKLKLISHWVTEING